MTHPAVGRGSGETHHVEQRSTPHGYHIGMAIDSEFAEALLEPRQNTGVVLHMLARHNHLGVGDKLHRVAMGLRIRSDLVRQRRPARRHIGIDEGGEAVPLTVLAPAQRLLEDRIVAIEDPFGEVHRVVVADREFLLIHRARMQVGHARGGRAQAVRTKLHRSLPHALNHPADIARAPLHRAWPTADATGRAKIVAANSGAGGTAHPANLASSMIGETACGRHPRRDAMHRSEQPPCQAVRQGFCPITTPLFQ